MRLVILIALIVLPFVCVSQTNDLYVSARSGLSMRQTPDAKAAVLLKIPYGTKLKPAHNDTTISISTEGLNGFWVKTTFNGKTGYIVDSYLLPWPPPKTIVKTMSDYFKQVSVLAGPVLTIKSAADPLEEITTITKKYLYKNGAEMHEEQFYESNNNNYFLPGFTIQQGFILVRLIPEFKDVFADSDVFPTSNKTFKKEGREYLIKVEKEENGGSDWYTRISVDYEEGAYYHFAMFVVGGQLMIVYGGGV